MTPKLSRFRWPSARWNRNAAGQLEPPQLRVAAAWNNGLVRKPDEETFYGAVGGHETFVRLVARFYAGVADDELLRPMYPEADLSDAATRLTMFLEQFWGGPTTYSDLRGRPRLGMRHARFEVTPTARDHWLGHMRVALEESGMSPEHVETFWEYVVRAAHFLVNTPDEEPARRSLDVR